MATLETYSGSNYIYLNVIKWAFRQKVAPWTEWATIRELVDKDLNPTWETRTEKVYNKITWRITDMYIKDLDFWNTLNIWIDNEIYISFMTNSEYFKDFVSKINNLNINEIITLIPYEMDVENKNPKTKAKFPTRKKRWLTIIQLWDKVSWDYYQEYDNEKKKFIYKNWIPEPDMKKVEKMGSKYWKTYFPEVDYFFEEEIKKVIDWFNKVEELPWDDISVEDAPF